GERGVDFSGTLRDYQAQAIEAAKSAGCGVIQAPTGSGKTVIAMGLVAALKTPTLIMVHTTVLLDQTAEKTREFLKTEPAIIGAGRYETGDVTIAMVQTLTTRGYKEIADRFGLVILDEAHHCPAVTFKEVVQEFPARYRIGLTATPTRKDRLHPVLYDTIGRIIHKIDQQRLVDDGRLVKARFFKIPTAFKYSYRKNYQRMINRLTADYDRNNLVIATIAETHKGKSLVLSERIDHCALLSTLLAKKGVASVLMTGKTAKEEREKLLEDFRGAEKGILISTTSLIGEGFDLPDLDTIYLTVPNGSPQKTTQILGRIMRPSSAEKDARIFDFADELIPVLKNQFLKRAKIYNR
ncbi:MAG: DEAD/DEAH box helicase, partial [Deltaproteobacteria bacterium]|nr:DEAD/DEAH box helicase [Deltaproteobacteria bacterium]